MRNVRADRLLLPKWMLMTTTERPDLLILKLIEKLHDADPIVRRNAAGALRLQGPRAAAAIPAITALLADEDPRVRCEAERAIDYLKLVAA
jgi:HEAT repeat protein